jgi:class 3 adenylate cyclase
MSVMRRAAEIAEKFCGSCGAPLRLSSGGSHVVGSSAQDPAPDTHPGERRQLTVLFCDLVGSTALSQQVDAEEWHAVVTRYQQAARAAVERWGGHVAKELGDGLLVYFGWPDAREDDPERAIRAGLDVVDGVRGLGVRGLGEESGPLTPNPVTPNPLHVRVGMHTGPVVIADGGEVFGETANTRRACRAQRTPTRWSSRPQPSRWWPASSFSRSAARRR